MKVAKIFGVVLFFIATAFAQPSPLYLAGNDTLTIEQLLDSLFPDSTDYRFLPPENWGANLATNARLLCLDSLSLTGIEALIDGDGFTAWTSAKGAPNRQFSSNGIRRSASTDWLSSTAIPSPVAPRQAVMR